MINIEALEQAVSEQTTTTDSFIMFVEQLKAQLSAELVNDPAAQAKVDAALSQVLANRQKMIDAMAANVPTP